MELLGLVVLDRMFRGIPVYRTVLMDVGDEPVESCRQHGSPHPEEHLHPLISRMVDHEGKEGSGLMSIMSEEGATGRGFH